MKNKYYGLIIILLIMAALTAVYFLLTRDKKVPYSSITNNQNAAPTIDNDQLVPPTEKPKKTEPISDALTRVTKKPFGIKVSPNNSPVSPEKFSGYHTGVDFETNQAEQNIDISIHAICDGALIYKNYVSGYGGVAIQSCQINGTDVTVLYGHLKLSSVSSKTNTVLKAGDEIGILGKGYSTETDGERKHLHLSIHKGKTIELRGYVQNANDLSSWIDPLKILK